MSDLKKVTRQKQKRDKSAYEKGVEQGWQDAFFFFIMLAFVIVAINDYIG